MGGDLDKIRIFGEYMIEVWKACGMDMKNVKFIWASDEINSHSNEYWMRVMDIARHFNLLRVKKCSTIIGPERSDDIAASQIFYHCMQVADIFHLKADICQLGRDQRKVNILARKYCDKLKIESKPIILSNRNEFKFQNLICRYFNGITQQPTKTNNSRPLFCNLHRRYRSRCNFEI